jgi:hypothetical protein
MGNNSNLLTRAVLAAAIAMVLAPSQTNAAPTAEVARRCLRYAYILYPHHRPGSMPASAGRETYFRDCLNKNGEVPEPTPPPKTP